MWRREVEASSTCGFLRVKFDESGRRFFFKDDARVTQNDWREGGKTTAEATHVGLFTSHFSFPKDPPPTLQFVYFSPHPVLLFYPGPALPPRLDRIVSRPDDSDLRKGTRRTPVVGEQGVRRICVCVCVAVSLGLCPASALTSMFLLAEQQIEPQLDPEILSTPTPPPPPSLPNVSHIKDETMTLCNILWI